LFQFVAEVAAK